MEKKLGVMRHANTLFGTIEIIETMTTTITVSDEVKRELLKVAARLQASTRRKIDYDDVLDYLVRRATRRLDLFRKACSPTGVSSANLAKELRQGRHEDRQREKTLEKQYS